MSSASTLHPAVAELLEARRLGRLESSRHRFTVSREEALLRLREQARERSSDDWAWTLALVRAANAQSEISEAKIEVEPDPADEELQITTLDVITPGADLDGLDLTDVLAGALQPDLGEPLTTRHDEDAAHLLELRARRFRMLIGRALNAALAREPVALELRTPAGGRRFERRERVSEGRDPYGERKIAGCQGSSRFVVRVIELRPGLGTRLGRWLRGRSELERVLVEMWTASVLSEGPPPRKAEQAEGKDDSVPLGPSLAHEPIALGSHALYGPASRLAEGAPERLKKSLWLARDGVVLLDLGPTLRHYQIDPAAVAGWVDCPSLRLTADEGSVVRDARLELLVAWLHDYLARREQLEQDSSEAEPRAFTWPESLGAGPKTASGRPLSPEQIADEVRRGRELVYVWRHQAQTVPNFARARVLALWPSQLRLLVERFEGIRLVPLRALGSHEDFDPADLTSLRAGSYEPLVLVRDAPLSAAGEGGAHRDQLRLSIEAYVHRARTANMGFIEILAYERRVASIRERAKVFPGVTLVCRIEGERDLDVAALRRDHATIATIAERCREQTRKLFEALLAHVMTRANPWENPLLRTALDELGPGRIQLRYIEPGDGPLRLAWNDTVLLDVWIARTREDGQDRTLRDALRQLRDRGFLIVARENKRYGTLQSKDPALRPWVVPDWSRPLLERVLGKASILEMPVVPEAHPLVADDPVHDQLHLIRTKATIAETLERSARDPLARLRLLGHLLVARGRGEDTVGLETVPLLERYDPRALSPTRLVSLATVLAERPRPGLVPAGAVHRELSRPMIEAVPGLAALLAATADLHPGLGAPSREGARAVESAASGVRGGAPVRRRARAVPPLLAAAVVHRYAIGRLVVAGDGSSDGIALWARGLRVGELELAEPLGRVSGRLLLTPEGQRVPRSQLHSEMVAQARRLLADALRQRTLLPPEGPQRRRLDHFVEYARAVVQRDDRFELAADLGIAPPSGDRGRRAAALRKMSLRALPLRSLSTSRREALLVDILRQSLAMPLRFDTAVLSWRLAKLGRRRQDGALELEFGLRNTWIQRALDEDRTLEPTAHLRAALLAATVVLATFFDQAQARDDLELGVEHAVVAFWRLLELS